MAEESSRARKEMVPVGTVQCTSRGGAKEQCNRAVVRERKRVQAARRAYIPIYVQAAQTAERIANLGNSQEGIAVS